MSTTEEITVEVTEHDPHDGDAVLAVLAAMFRPTAPSSIPAMPTASLPTATVSPAAASVTTGAAMCRARSFLLDPGMRASAPMTRTAQMQLAQPVDVDILGPSDAVQQARRMLAGVFTVQDLGWVSGEHEFETRLRLT